jgi:hypothetical protein
MADKRFARFLLAQEDTELEDKSKVEYSSTQLDNFHASIASSILELRAAMVDKWGPIEDLTSKPSSFAQNSKVGVPVPDRKSVV